MHFSTYVRKRKSIDNDNAATGSCQQQQQLQQQVLQVVATVGNKDSEDMYLVPVEHFTSHCLMYFVCPDMARSSCHRHRHRPCQRAVLNAILKRLEDTP